jgi:hypothetical protein
MKRAREESSSAVATATATATGGGAGAGAGAYLRRGGLRHVRPYLHLFETFVKGRWLGRDLLDVYAAEFGGKPREYYAAALADGRIRVSGERACAGTRLKHGQRLQVLTSDFSVFYLLTTNSLLVSLSFFYLLRL